jgi:hypothetical protein
MSYLQPENSVNQTIESRTKLIRVFAPQPRGSLRQSRSRNTQNRQKANRATPPPRRQSNPQQANWTSRSIQPSQKKGRVSGHSKAGDPREQGYGILISRGRDRLMYGRISHLAPVASTAVMTETMMMKGNEETCTWDLDRG